MRLEHDIYRKREKTPFKIENQRHEVVYAASKLLGITTGDFYVKAAHHYMKSDEFKKQLSGNISSFKKLIKDAEASDFWVNWRDEEKKGVETI